jgi:predicted nucleic acid-binding protein
MAILFLDSSALVKRSIAEAGSLWVGALAAPTAGNVIHLSVITGAEVIAAFVRRQRGGNLTPDEATRAIAEFTDDWTTFYELIGVDREVINRTMLLAQRHALRGYDAVQLASVLEVKGLARQVQATLTFISADDELNAAAAAEGLAVENPNRHP